MAKVLIIIEPAEEYREKRRRISRAAYMEHLPPIGYSMAPSAFMYTLPVIRAAMLLQGDGPEETTIFLSAPSGIIDRIIEGDRINQWIVEDL